MRKQLLIGSSLLLLAGCDLAPDFVLPEITVPAMFKEAPAASDASIEPVTDGAWKRTDEKAQIEEFAWWQMFNDPALNALQEQAMKDNPSLEVAAARVVSARANAASIGADLYPAVSVGFGPERRKASSAAINASSSGGFTVDRTKPYTLYTAQGTISYDLDIFGRNRNRTREAENQAAIEDNNYRAARLSLQAELAQTYFGLAARMREAEILAQTLKLRTESLALIRKKRDVGEVDDLQVGAAETDLATVSADAAAVKQLQAVQEHTLAILVGQSPAAFTVPRPTLTTAPPAIPAALPATLLERRPDVQAAVAQLAAANARIGIARTGYFPDISLTAQGGFTSGSLSNLFDWSNRTWLLGPLVGTVLTQPIFEGGRLSAAIAQSRADYGSAVSAYRAAVLQAFREVEDQLSGVRNLSDQAAATESAVKSAKRAHAIAQQRYRVGYASYLEYLDAERSLLAAERANVQVAGNRYVTTIQLVKALGGSWQSAASTTPVAPVDTSVVDKATDTSPAAVPAPATLPEAKPSRQPKLAPLR